MKRKILLLVTTMVLILATTCSSFAGVQSNIEYTEDGNSSVTYEIEIDDNSSENEQMSRGILKTTVILGMITTDDKIKITMTKDSVKKVTIDGKVTVKDAKGNSLGTKNVDYSTTAVAKTITWEKAKSTTTVQENIVFSGKVTFKGETESFKMTLSRGNYVGGKYGTMKALQGERHHMPSKDALKSSKTSEYNGPAVRMYIPDHKKTASYGTSASAKEFRASETKYIKNGYFLKAQKLGINDLKDTFGSKYTKAINSMVSYTKNTLGYTK